MPYTSDNTYASNFESVPDIYNTSYSTLLEVDSESPLLSFARNKQSS
ncbi:BQ2448_5762 [Microbotryum intermedium]|uniref:BQ2448_5762 protein n=1 Tax=Microbotryum intermedium TaxID=269621 RepID=A0A238F7Q5_9BASI|nr:BQ2448_5762 [Microbotryum intermedium]